MAPAATELLLVVVVMLASKAKAHSAITIPEPRNAVDSEETPWGGPVPTPLPFEPWCPIPSASATSDARNISGSNGQACFWFSNGCAIGCEECDGSTRGPIPSFSCTEDECSPTGKPIEFGPKAPICGAGAPAPRAPGASMNATMCDPAQRTVNTAAKCGSPEDYFYYSPWRAPGYAPVIDSCGVAGGRLPGQGPGGFGAEYVNTSNAKIGDLGSATLLERSTGVVWPRSTEVEVAWTLQANHGGGYSYRLCPLGATLDEECFNRHPLQPVDSHMFLHVKFLICMQMHEELTRVFPRLKIDRMVGKSALRWGGVGGRTLQFDAVDVTEGTKAGVMWRKNPVPRAWKTKDGAWGKGSNHEQTGWGFQPVCEDDGMDSEGTGQSCTGMWGPYNLEIVDKVRVPTDLSPGKWVLNWRMDQEESNQIWQSCSDITLA